MMKEKKMNVMLKSLMITIMLLTIMLNVNMVSAGEWEGETIQKLDRVVLWRFDDLRATSSESIFNDFKSVIENVTDYGGYCRIAFISGANDTYTEGLETLVYTQEQIDNVLEILDINRDLVNLSYHGYNHSEPYTHPWREDGATQQLHLDAAMDTVRLNFGFDLEGFVGPGGEGNYNLSVVLKENGISGYDTSSYTLTVADDFRYIEIYGNGENTMQMGFSGPLDSAKTNFTSIYNRTNIIQIVLHPVVEETYDGYIENFTEFVEFVYNDHNIINMDWEDAIDYRMDLFEVDSVEKIERIKLNQLFEYSTNVNEYELMKDIDFQQDSSYENVSLKNDYISGTGWCPISISSGAYFNGMFDGNGFSIYNLFINRSASNDIGLFGHTRNTLKLDYNIKDLKLLDINITGKDEVGSLVGYMSDYTKIINSSIVGGNIIGVNYVGGMVGRTSTVYIDNCFTNVTISNSSRYVGGFVGRLIAGFVNNSYSHSNISHWANFLEVGGFCGQTATVINNCYSTGSLNRLDGADWTTKGFVGANTSTGITNNCFWDNQTSGQTSSNCTCTGLYTTVMQTLSTFTDAGWEIAEDGSWDGETWYIDDGVDYPRLSFERESSISDVYPADDSTEVSRPPVNLSAYITGSDVVVSFYFINMTPIIPVWTLITTVPAITNEYVEYTNLSSFGLGTEFTWGNTEYTWSVNVSNGVSWTNETYTYTTTASASGDDARLDIDNNNVVSTSDLNVVWARRAATYDSLLDVDGNEVVSTSDLNMIWAGRN